MIGGNTLALFQVKGSSSKNKIGERVTEWTDALKVRGFLDLSGGDSKYTLYNAKITESTHIYICDYTKLVYGKKPLTSENSRVIIDGSIYDVMLIDNPMGLCKHLEIYLKYVGGQNAV